jgi:hypothetical protein
MMGLKDPFEGYFYKRADLADQIAASGSVIDAYTLATASLDALAEIWLNDFPDAKKNLEIECGGSIPSSIRLTRLLKNFVSHDPRVSKVAVVCFAEDWKRYRPQEAHIAELLLNNRLSDDSDEFMRRYEPPKSSLDLSREELAKECPELAVRQDLFALAEEYEYGAFLYSFYRCPLVHSAIGSEQTNGYVTGEQIMYRGSTIGFGINLVTRWLRDATSGYIQHCQQVGVTPANNINSGISQENRYKSRWNKLV